MSAAQLTEITVDDFPPRQRSLRIAFVTETYPPEINGVAVTIERIVKGLHERNHELQLVRPRQSRTDFADTEPRFQEILMRGLPIPRYPSLKMGLPSKRALVDLWSLKRPDIVHIATEGPLGWSALQAVHRLKLPVSSDFRTNFHAYSKHYGVGWLHKPIMAYLRKFHNQTQCTMVPTEGLRRSLEEYGFQNLSVLARGVDADLFDPARRSEALRQSWGAGPDTTVVLHVGRLAPEKNLRTLIVAYEAMRAVNTDVKLVLVGDGPARAEIQVRCPGAVFAGMRAGDDLASHYASGDVFLFPSLTETFGNVTPEAMASGLAVVAYDYAAAAQLIRSGENGVLAPFDVEPQFVRAATDLASQPQRIRELGTRARRTACEIGWARIIEQLESVFGSVIALGPMARRASLFGATLQLR
jgi:glycosyltransferase involved in cell wall biosynthesis